jgi:hypothetical protein
MQNSGYNRNFVLHFRQQAVRQKFLSLMSARFLDFWMKYFAITREKAVKKNACFQWLLSQAGICYNEITDTLNKRWTNGVLHVTEDGEVRVQGIVAHVLGVRIHRTPRKQSTTP